MSAEPMASGARGPASPGLSTVKPIVATRKKAPMNSTRYLVQLISYLTRLGQRFRITAHRQRAERTSGPAGAAAMTERHGTTECGPGHGPAICSAAYAITEPTTPATTRLFYCF